MIDLLYVQSAEEVEVEANKLRKFIPPMIMKDGRFFGARSNIHPEYFVVGIHAEDKQHFNDLTWYMDKVGIKWILHGRDARIEG